jgi:pseudouridine-5'-phosphate glycosidase
MNSLAFTASPEVASALAAGKPVVALESTIISHGLPRPSNLQVAREVEDIVRAHGATPATIAILDGKVLIGLTDDQLVEIANRNDIANAYNMPFQTPTVLTTKYCNKPRQDPTGLD